MRNILIFCFCALVGMVAKAQNVMVVEKNDNTTYEFNVDDIRQVYFQNKGGDIIEPSASELYPKLKDGNGKTLFLTFVGTKSDYDNNTGRVLSRFVYDENGKLMQFGRYPESDPAQTYYVSGQSFYSYSTLPEYYETAKVGVDVNMTLNSEGLVASMSIYFRYLHQEGRNNDIYKHNYTLSYNSEKQLTKVEGDLYIENYDKNNNLEYAKVNESMMLTWENGNLVKVDRIYTEVEKVGDPDGGRSWTATLEYDNTPNACKQYTKGFSKIRFFWGEYGIEQLFMLGLFGVGPAKLPTSISTVDAKHSTSYQYTYTLNNNGTVATEKSSGSSTEDIYVYK